MDKEYLGYDVSAEIGGNNIILTTSESEIWLDIVAARNLIDYLNRFIEED